MSTLAEASLTDSERRMLDRFVAGLSDELGERLRSIWLYGSRARGERPHPESDIDVLVVVDPEDRDDLHRAVRTAYEAERATGGNVLLSTLVYSSERIAQRREIRSFFIQEVDRDKIVLFGEP